MFSSRNSNALQISKYLEVIPVNGYNTNVYYKIFPNKIYNFSLKYQC